MNDTPETIVPSSFKDKNDDPGFLVAKGRFQTKDDETGHVKRLANAIFMAVQNHGYATVRAVGCRASYNALKAINIATGYVAPKGIELVWQSSFSEGNLGPMREEGHVDTVTAMQFSIKGFKDWTEERQNA